MSTQTPPNKETADEADDTQRPLLLTLLSNAAAILALSGIVAYGVLAICYDRFYKALGISSADVGLTYGNVLANSTGMILLIILVLIFLTITKVLDWVNRFFGRLSTRHQQHLQGGKLRRTWAHTTNLIAAILTLVLMYWALGALSTDSAQAADAVKHGRPVVSPHIGPTTILVIHADPVTIQPATTISQELIDQYIQNRKMLYLGEANGTVVLYDSQAQEAIFLPATSIILSISNCATRYSFNPLCISAYR